MAWKVIKSPIILKPLDVRCWNLDTMWVLMIALCKNRIWRFLVMWPKFYSPKMGRKLTSLNRYISVITDIDGKWFVILEHTINCLSVGYARLPQLEYYFSFFFLFSYLFFFLIILLRLSTFKPLNTPYSKFERLKILGRDSAQMKLGVPGWGDPPLTSPPKFWTFKLLELDESNFRNG